ncbi:MAG: hypothetical protein NTZ18_00600 [Candidatus Komeilibacteria bacterium]|nr:hypothetical protein [Candidatus Komeilibacteria bacterium]
MLENSKDLLNIIIAFCVLWLTIFVCWVIYYFAMILKRVYQVTETFNKTMEAVREFFEKSKEKVNNFGNAIAAVMEVGKKVADYVQEKKAKKTARRKNAKSE